MFKHNSTKLQNSQRGVSLYLAFMIMFVVLTMALGISLIVVSQIRMIRGMGFSVIAILAADTGIEEVLMERTDPDPAYAGFLDLNGIQASYSIIVTEPPGKPLEDPDIPEDVTCNADNYCVRSVGSFENTKRAIEINY